MAQNVIFLTKIMSLDIYFSKETGDFYKLKATKLVASIEFFEHESIAEDGLFECSGILARLKDYYKDAKIYHSELSEVSRRIVQWKGTLANEDSLSGATDELIQILEQAKADGYSIYFIAD